jgi:hypothetical protein
MVVARNFGERNYEFVSLQACAKCESATMGPRNPARPTAVGASNLTPRRQADGLAAGPGPTQLTLDSLPIASYTALSVTLETSGDTSRTPEEPRTARSAPAGARWTLKGSGHSSQLCLPIASYTALSVTLETHLMTSGTADKYW